MNLLNSKLLGTRFKKSYYAKMLLFYSAFTVVIIFISFTLPLNLFNQSFEKEIKQSNERLLEQVRIYIDKYFLSKINSIISEKFLDMTSDPILLDFFSYSNPKNTDEIMGAYRNISNISINYEFINSIYLYRKSDDTFLSSSEGITYNAASNIKSHIIDYIDNIKKTVPPSQTKFWLNPPANRGFFNDTPMISYIQSIPIYSSFDSSNGFFIVNINQRTLFDSINKTFGADGDLMVIDSLGRLFAQSNSNQPDEIISAGGIMKSVLSSNEGFMVTEISGKNYGVSWIKSLVNDWKYVSVVPVETMNQKIIAVRNVILIIFGFVALISLVGLKVLTSHLYLPLKLLTRKVTDSFSIANTSENELNYINNVFSFLAGKVDDMETTIKNNQETIKYKAIIDILYENANKESEIKSRLKLFNISFESKYFTIIIMEMDKRISTQISAEQNEYIMSKTNEFINRHFSLYCSCISITYPTGCITAILNFDDPAPVLKDFYSLLSRLKNEIDINFNVCASKMVQTFSSLPKIYRETQEFLKYSYIYGYGNTFSQSTIERYEASAMDLNPNIILQMETYLRSCKIDKLKAVIREQVGLIKSNGYSYRYSQTLLFQTIGAISRVCRELGIHTEQLEKDRILHDFNKILNMDDCLEWIDSIIDLYYENVNKRNLSIDNEFIQKIVGYIAANVDKQISLYAVAKEFNISSSYLSRIFKESLDTSFSDFIASRKLEKACELLRNNRNKKISEIAESLGYVTPAYFSRIFKEKYGMTPALYRKKTLTDQGPTHPQ